MGRSTGRDRRVVRRALALACVACIGVAACSGDDAEDAGDEDAGEPGTATTAPRPAGPEADLSTQLEGGNGVFLGEAVPDDLEDAGYVEEELAATGTATSYRPQGGLAGDGAWTFEPAEEAAYRTRVLVRRPADPERFSGDVVVEWLNVSGGVDANPEWVSIREEVLRAGDAWVGVSAQRIGVEGGPVLVQVSGIAGAEHQGTGLTGIDPERYGALAHPGDGFSFDIYTQVARALRTGAGLDGQEPQRLIAAGESQSAFALVSYYNGVQPLTRAFDGFFVHSRGAASLPVIDEAGGYADLAGGLGGTPTTFRTDEAAPVLNVQTEGDLTGVLNSFPARQDDSDTFRLWEVAGTAHADTNLVGPNAAALDCGVPINDGPMHIVTKAALHALKAWVDTGEAPVTAPRLEVTDADTPAIDRDGDGIALGGIRTPLVDVPVAVLSGEPGPDPSTVCLLMGSTQPLPADRLAGLYPSADDYLSRYESAADDAVDAGFVLDADREALMEFADPSAL
jgi:hypothetical protein